MPETPPRAVTISEIAAQAGVSMPTVSRVLNRRSDVAPQTRERVEQLLREHGYQRRGPRADDRAWLIDLVFNDLDSPWAVEVIRGVEEAAHAAGAGTVVSAIHRRRSSARQWLENLRTRASDGVILVTTALDPDLHAELRRLHVPAVVVDPAGVPDLDVPTIGATNWAGGVSATEHLTRLGHRRIGFIAGRPGLWCSRARLDGYRAGLEAVGVALDPDLVAEGDFDDASGCEGARRLLALPDRPTAVLRGQRRDGHGRLRGRAPAGPAGAGGPQRRRLRRPAAGLLDVPAADDGAPAAVGDGHAGRPHRAAAAERRAPRVGEGRARDRGRRPAQHGRAGGWGSTGLTGRSVPGVWATHTDEVNSTRDHGVVADGSRSAGGPARATIP